MSDISNYVRRGKNVNREDINKLLGLITPFAFAEPEDEGVQERIVVTPGTRKRTLTKSTGLDITDTSGNKERLNGEITIQMPTVCQAYPFSQTDNGSIAWEKNQGSTYGAGAIFDGSTDYITIPNIVGSDLDLERTDSFSIAFMFKRANDGTLDTIIAKRDDIAPSDVGYSIIISANGEIVWDISDGTTEMQVRSSLNLDDGNWHTCVCTYDGTSNETGMTLYIDGADDGTTGSDTVSSTIINTKALVIGAESDAGDKFTGSLAWVMVLKEELTSGWVTKYHGTLVGGVRKSHLDFSGGNLVFYAPFYGRTNVYGEARVGYCAAS